MKFLVLVILVTAMRVQQLLPIIITVILIVWFLRQFHGARPQQWEMRGKALAAVGIVVAEDAVAVGRMAKAPFQRRLDLRNADLDGELRKLLER